MFSKYDKSLTYLIACSGGPDSMALLDMLVKVNFKLIVCNVNYKTRKESDSEELLVKDYCKKHNLICEVAIFDNNYKGNFENAARVFRYDFFNKMYLKYKASGLFVAHHKDDLIETYLLKLKRNVINESYLIKDETTIKSMKVYRPLLNSFYKEDLLKYCDDNAISYGIDYTNFLDIHTRNIIRKKLVNMDKNEMYNKALKDEEKLMNTRNEVLNYLSENIHYLIKDLVSKDDFYLKIFLFEAIDSKYKRKAKKELLLTLKNFINSDKPNLSYKIEDNYYLKKSYDYIYFLDDSKTSFSYKLDKLEFIKTNEFTLVDYGAKMEGIYLSDDDFPIIIRNYNKDDVIKLKEGNKKVSRLFIDKKVPSELRDKLVVIENSNKEIIFVYKLYRKYGLKYIKNNLFVIQ